MASVFRVFYGKKTRLYCAFCEKSYLKPTALLDHLSSHPSDYSLSSRCVLCRAEFSALYLLMRHLRSQHTSRLPEDTSDRRIVQLALLGSTTRDFKQFVTNFFETLTAEYPEVLAVLRNELFELAEDECLRSFIAQLVKDIDGPF